MVKVRSTENQKRDQQIQTLLHPFSPALSLCESITTQKGNTSSLEMLPQGIADYLFEISASHQGKEGQQLLFSCKKDLIVFLGQHNNPSQHYLVHSILTMILFELS
jgi:hypothetical protein